MTKPNRRFTLEWPIEVAFKKPELERHLVYIHPKVFDACAMAMVISNELGAKYWEFTSLIRPKIIEGESGVHQTGRAIDANPRWGQSKPKAFLQRMGKIATLVNLAYPRSDGKSTCIYHDSGTGWHFHFQCEYDPAWKDLTGQVPSQLELPSYPQFHHLLQTK